MMHVFGFVASASYLLMIEEWMDITGVLLVYGLIMLVSLGFWWVLYQKVQPGNATNSSFGGTIDMAGSPKPDSAN